MINEQSFIKERSYGHTCHDRGFTWSAIILGGLVGFGLTFLLNLFGFAIGLTAFKLSTDGLLTLAVGGLLGMILGSLVTMFVTGWVAGFYARSYCIHPHYGVVYGFTAWCLALIICVFAAGFMGHFLMSEPYMANQNSAVIANVQAHTMQAVAEKSDINPNVTTATAQKNTEMAAHNMGISLAGAFIVFFLSALASCFGGYFGMKHRISKGCVVEPVTQVKIE